jgi:hypothetical protein
VVNEEISQHAESRGSVSCVLGVEESVERESQDLVLLFAVAPAVPDAGREREELLLLEIEMRDDGPAEPLQRCIVER